MSVWQTVSWFVNHNKINRLVTHIHFEPAFILPKVQLRTGYPLNYSWNLHRMKMVLVTASGFGVLVSFYPDV
jgi:hypothetical protein